MNKNNRFNLWLIVALLAGIICGLFSFEITTKLSTVIITLFINTLKLISLPIIFLAILSTITKMNNLREAAYMVKKILKYTVLTTLIAASIALLLFYFINPTSTLTSIPGDESLSSVVKTSYLHFLLNIIPSNPVVAVMENNVLGITFMAVILSIALLKIPHEKGAVVKSFFQSLFDALLKISSWIIHILPIGVFAFTIQFIRNIKTDQKDLKLLLMYALCVILANVVQGLIVLPIFLKMKGISPWRLAKNMMPALTMAFFSKSSSATLPLSLECAKKRANISDKTASFSFPLCSVINMNGCAAFILITVLFISIHAGAQLSFFEMVLWIFIATLAAIGNAGVPMGCFFLTSAFLIGMDIPLGILGMILPLYAMFDMVETALNVWSDSCITATVDKEVQEEKLTTPVVT